MKLYSYGLSLLAPLSAVTHAQTCKYYPEDSQWPSQPTWQALNDTVSGRLTVPVALGKFCRPDDFDNTTCTQVATQFSNSSWVAQNPWMSDYNDDTCALKSTSACTTSGYPAYVIEAINAEDVQAGVNFARDNNVRLIVKGTGHDYPGRSAGSEALSIYTHNIRGVEIVPDDPTALRYGGVAAVKIGAGMRWREIYTEAAKNNLTVIGGAENNVGVGGWILNGGHSPISSLYGLGADQVLSFDVVTADGKFTTVNETSQPDLFWALRGGGGSTFAVMISVTVKAYPQLPGVLHSYSIATTTGSETYLSLMAYFHTQIPSLNEAGGMGYHYFVPGAVLGDPNLANLSIMAGLWYFPNRDETYVNATLLPFYTAVQSAEWAKDPLYIQGGNSYVPSFLTSWLNNTSEVVGSTGRLGSWLLDGPALSNFTAVKELLGDAFATTGFLISHLVAGPGTRNAVSTIPGGSNAVLPAWRKAYTHVVLSQSWTAGNATEKALATTALRERAVPPMKRLAPDSGAYINEADPSNTDWKNDYFGENYNKLLEIKHKYDPDGVFWCKPCVGWDEWETRDGPTAEDVLEWGIGQGLGKLCKKA